MDIKKIRSDVDYNKINKLCESRFGFSVNFDKMTVSKAKKIYETINRGISKMKLSENYHSLHKNRKYMELVTLREGMKDWLSRKNIMESETAQAEVLLAAKNIVDEIQNMTEKVSKIQNEDLVAIVDSARDVIGVQQADQFRDSVFGSLSDLLTSLQQHRETVDTSVRRLSGEPVADMGVDQAMQSPTDKSQMGSADVSAPSKPMPRQRRSID